MFNVPQLVVSKHQPGMTWLAVCVEFEVFLLRRMVILTCEELMMLVSAIDVVVVVSEIEVVVMSEISVVAVVSEIDVVVVVVVSVVLSL